VGGGGGGGGGGGFWVSGKRGWKKKRKKGGRIREIFAGGWPVSGAAREEDAAGRKRKGEKMVARKRFFTKKGEADIKIEQGGRERGKKEGGPSRWWFSKKKGGEIKGKEECAPFSYFLLSFAWSIEKERKDRGEKSRTDFEGEKGKRKWPLLFLLSRLTRRWGGGEKKKGLVFQGERRGWGCSSISSSITRIRKGRGGKKERDRKPGGKKKESGVQFSLYNLSFDSSRGEGGKRGKVVNQKKKKRSRNAAPILSPCTGSNG